MKKKVVAILLILIISLGLISCGKEEKKEVEDKKVVAAYIMLDDILKKDFNIEEFSTKQFKDGEVTHLFVSFGNVGEENRLIFRHNLNEVEAAIEKLRNAYKDTKICLSIGGASLKKEDNKKYYNFSEMAKTVEGRSTFVNSIIDFVDKNNLDGIDMNWEFPVQGGWGSIDAAPEDKVNFTYLIKELRKELDSLEGKTKKDYSLSFANTSQKFGLEVYEIEEVLKVVDFMNLMTYDFAGNWSNRTALNSSLYYSKAFGNKDNNIKDVIKMYEDNGLSQYLNKIVIGIPAYACGWTSVGTNNNGKNQIARDFIDVNKNTLPYKDVNEKKLKVTYTKKDGNQETIEQLERVWDDEAKAAYLFKGGENSVFISYEDPQAVAEKGNFVKEKGLGGMMMWQAPYDDGTLIKAMIDNLK